MPKKIRKAVLPVAGLGTRFLPATKTVPKEMLTVVDRPILQHVVDEAMAAGIEHFVFVTGRMKAVIEDYFDIAYELEDTLNRRGKTKELAALRNDLPAAGATQVHAPAGASRPRSRDLVRARHRRRRAVRGAAAGHGDDGRRQERIALPRTMRGDLREARRQRHRRGGSAAGGDAPIRHRRHRRGLRRDFEISGMVEKPKQGNGALAISSFPAATSCNPRSSPFSKSGEKGAGGEIQLTDGMKELAETQAFHGVRFDGRTYECGSKIGFLAANLAFALARPDIEPPFAPRSQST